MFETLTDIWKRIRTRFDLAISAQRPAPGPLDKVPDISPAIRREEFLRLLPGASPILEIGPFAKPAIKGPQVKYFDVMDQSALVARANEIGLPADEVPSIDYVSALGDLTIVDEKMRCVVSSHCIEHQPDLVRHLNQVENILLEEGLYFLMVPDKRYCFDHFLAESTIAQVLDAHHSKRILHTLASVIEHRALTTHNDPLRHWKRDHGEAAPDVDRIREAMSFFGTVTGHYVDVHAWQFTPQSFRTIMQTLHELSLTRLFPLRVYDTPYGSNEFCAILRSRSAPMRSPDE